MGCLTVFHGVGSVVGTLSEDSVAVGIQNHVGVCFSLVSENLQQEQALNTGLVFKPKVYSIYGQKLVLWQCYGNCVPL